MSPHTILSNIASISTIEGPQHAIDLPRNVSYFNSSSLTDLLSYVGNLLDQPRQSFGAGLLSPTEPDTRPIAVTTGSSSTMKDFVDLAILRSNLTTPSKPSSNRYAITRSGDRVATIVLARPAYRLGETIPVVIDLQDSDVHCYSLEAALETSESIDPAIALRSKASIYRITKRVYACQFESTIAAKKVWFNPTIPLTSTPDFITSGLNLEWRLRFGFVTSRVRSAEDIEEGHIDLMEEVARDERGRVKAAVQSLSCEAFDVTVPLRVYGAVTSFEERAEPSEFPI